MRIRAIVAAAALTGMTMGLAHAQVTDDGSTAATRTITPGVVSSTSTTPGATLSALTGAQTATPATATPAGNQNTPAARAAANDAKMEKAGVPSTTPGTAYDQGLADANSAAAAQAALDNYQEFNSARQKGVQSLMPMPANPVASQPALNGWFANWKDVLVDIGVDDRQINFEAARLSEDQFARWASRLVRANNPGLNAIVAQPAAPAADTSDTDTSDASN